MGSLRSGQCHIDADCNTKLKSDTDQNAYAHCDWHRYSDCDSNCDRDRYSDCDCNLKPNADINPTRNPEPNRNSNSASSDQWRF